MRSKIAPSFSDVLQYGHGTHLVGSVGDADVKVRDVDLDEISDENVQLPLFRPILPHISTYLSKP